MTQAEAQTFATDQTALLPGAVSANIKYKAHPQWDVRFNKDYYIALIPTSYDVQFDAATESQQLAFARVSLQVQSIDPPVEDSEDFVTQYIALATADAELAAYLGL